MIGDIASIYESNNDVSAVGNDPTGGRSYGTYQLASKTGTVADWLEHEGGQFDTLKDLDPNSAEFEEKYKQLASEQGDELRSSQRAYIERTHYEPALNHAEELGLNTDDKRVKEAIWSTSVQHGGVDKILDRVAEQNVTTPEDTITAIYNARTEYVEDLDGVNSDALAQRYEREKRDVLELGQSVPEGGVRVGQLTSRNIERMAMAVGYDGIEGELSDKQKRQLYNEYAVTKFNELGGNERAANEVIKNMPEAYSALGLIQPIEDVDSFNIRAVERFGDDLSALDRRLVVNQLAEDNVKSRHKGVNKDVRDALIDAEIIRLNALFPEEDKVSTSRPIKSETGAIGQVTRGLASGLVSGVGQAIQGVGSFLGYTAGAVAGGIVDLFDDDDDRDNNEGVLKFLSDVEKEQLENPNTLLVSSLGRVIQAGGDYIKGDLDESDTIFKYANMVGNVGSYILPGLGAARALNVGARVARGVNIGFAVGATGQEGYEDVVATEKRLGVELSDEDKREAFFLNSAVNSLLEYAPAGKAVKRFMGKDKGVFDWLDKASDGAFKRAIKGGAKGAFEEGVTEALQTAASNYIASDIVTYDEERNVWEGTTESGEDGAVVGFLLNSIAGVVGGRRKARQVQNEQPPVFEPIEEETPVQEEEKSLFHQALDDAGYAYETVAPNTVVIDGMGYRFNPGGEVFDNPKQTVKMNGRVDLINRRAEGGYADVLNKKGIKNIEVRNNTDGVVKTTVSNDGTITIDFDMSNSDVEERIEQAFNNLAEEIYGLDEDVSSQLYTDVESRKLNERIDNLIKVLEGEEPTNWSVSGNRGNNPKVFKEYYDSASGSTLDGTLINPDENLRGGLTDEYIKYKTINENMNDPNQIKWLKIDALNGNEQLKGVSLLDLEVDVDLNSLDEVVTEINEDVTKVGKKLFVRQDGVISPTGKFETEQQEYVNTNDGVLDEVNIRYDGALSDVNPFGEEVGSSRGYTSENGAKNSSYFKTGYAVYERDNRFFIVKPLNNEVVKEDPTKAVEKILSKTGVAYSNDDGVFTIADIKTEDGTSITIGFKDGVDVKLSEDMKGMGDLLTVVHPTSARQKRPIQPIEEDDSSPYNFSQVVLTDGIVEGDRVVVNDKLVVEEPNKEKAQLMTDLAQIALLRRRTILRPEDGVSWSQLNDEDKADKLNELERIKSLYPSSIREAITIVTEKKGKHWKELQENRAWGLYSPTSKTIIIDAVTGSPLQAMRTMSEEVGHFAWDKIQIPQLRTVFDAIWEDLSSTIIKEPALELYVERLGTETPHAKMILINEYFSKQGIGVAEMAQPDVGAIKGEDGIEIPVNKWFNELTPDQQVEFKNNIKPLYEPMLKTLVNMTDNDYGVGLTINDDTGQVVIKNTLYGSDSIKVKDDQMEQYIQDLKKYSKKGSNRGVWSWDRLKGVMGYQYRRFIHGGSLGQRTTQFMTMSDNMLRNELKTYGRKVKSDILEIKSLLHDYGYVGNVPKDRDYHQVFAELNIPVNETTKEIADKANAIIRDSDEHKARQALSIRRAYEDTFDILVKVAQDPNEGVTNQDIKSYREWVDKRKDSIEGVDYVHRSYDVDSKDGQERLRLMRDMLSKSDPTSLAATNSKTLDKFNSSIANDEYRQAAKELSNRVKQIQLDIRSTLLSPSQLKARISEIENDDPPNKQEQIDQAMLDSVTPKITFNEGQQRINEAEHEFRVKIREDKKLNQQFNEVRETIWLENRLEALRKYVMLNDKSGYKKALRQGKSSQWLYEQMLNEINEKIISTSNKRTKSTNITDVSDVASSHDRKLDPTNRTHQHRMDFLGLETDPLVNSLESVLQQSNLLSTLNTMNQFGQYAIDTGMAKFSLKPTNPFHADKNRGTIVELLDFRSKEVIDELQEIAEANELSTENIVTDIVRGFKQNLTVYNLANGVANYTGNITKSFLDGSIWEMVLNPSLFIKSLKGSYNVAKHQVTDVKGIWIEELIRDMADSGTLAGGVDSVMSEWNSGSWVEQTIKTLGTLNKKDPKSKLKRQQIDNLMSVVKALYGAGDDAAKVPTFILNRELGRAKADLYIKEDDYGDMNDPLNFHAYHQDKREMMLDYVRTKTNAENIAFDIMHPGIKNTMRGKGTGGLGFVTGDFMAHPSQWARVLMTQFELIKEERAELKQLKKDNLTDSEYYKLLRRRNLTRMAGNGLTHGSFFTAATGMTSGLYLTVAHLIAQNIAGDDEEMMDLVEHNALSTLLAMRNITGSPVPVPAFVRDGDNFYTTNMNRVNVNASLFIKPESFSEGFKDLLSQFVNVEGTLAEKALQILRRENSFTGAKMTRREQLTELASIGVPRTFVDVAELVFGESLYGKKVDKDLKAVKMLTGVSIKPVNFTDFGKGFGMEYSNALSLGTKGDEYSRSLFKLIRQPIKRSHSEVVGRMTDALSSRRKAFERINKSVYLMREYGKDDEQIFDILTRGRSDTAYNKEVMRSVIDGVDPSATKLLDQLKSERDRIRNNKKTIYGVTSTEDVEIILDNFDLAIGKLNDYIK